MTDAITKVNAFSSEWVDVIFAVLWQSTVMAIAVAILLVAWRQLSPRLRCWAWRLVAVKLLVMPFWMVTIPVPHHVSITPTPIAAANPVPQPQVTIGGVGVPMADLEIQTSSAATMAVTVSPSAPFAWQTWLVGVWLSVVVIQLMRLIWQRVALRRLLAAARPADETILKIVANGCGQLRIARSPETRVTSVDVSPFVCRILRPILLLPESMAHSYDATQLRQIVLHELAHVRRGDLLWCWITHLARLVYWFHPVAHWVAFRESLERELACDDLAMSHSGATAADYAQTLIAAASRLAQPVVFRAAAAAHLDGGNAIGSPWLAATGGASTAKGDNR